MRNLSKKNSYSSTWNYSGQKNLNGIHCSLKEEIAHFTGWNVLTSKRQWVNKNDLRLLSGLKFHESMNTRWHLCKASCLSFTPWSALFPQVLKGQCSSSLSAYLHILKEDVIIYQRLWLVAVLHVTCLEAVNLGYMHRIAAVLLPPCDKTENMTNSRFFYFSKFFISTYGFPINPIALTTLPGHKRQQWLQIVTPGLVPGHKTQKKTRASLSRTIL